ncbi:hypothetical protein QN277_001122 [Acacia crassicarpa]|uniref:Uncharacterized protein n=1 Tax=Acacia crassicarpa TaxID=499986 RepID=A0AAE1IVE7_9FABA|nr:hypothetical protein QN277_007578 [Acacia crassicarpa]KAK4284267.1 hypothetical protein QN277_001122 [Acacia crassicarpa]
MGYIRVASFTEANSTRNDWSLCVKVVDSFWDMPPSKMHKQMTYNVILADSQGYIVLAVCRRRDICRRLCGVLVRGICFVISGFTVKPGHNIINNDLQIVIEPYTKVEFIRDIIIIAEKIFTPLRDLAESTTFDSSLINVVGLVTSVTGLKDVLSDQELLYRFSLSIVDQWGSPFHCCLFGTPAYWASVSYTMLEHKHDAIVALCWVKMKKMADGKITFVSHHDLSWAIFNYNSQAVVDFRNELKQACAAMLGYDNASPET